MPDLQVPGGAMQQPEWPLDKQDRAFASLTQASAQHNSPLTNIKANP
jgi:hypothetical protein